MAIAAFLWRLSFLGKNLSTQMYLTTDYTHHFAILSWIHRALFEGAGELISAPFFHPEKGILATGEPMFLLGVLFGLLRELSLSPVLSWNICYGLTASASALAAYGALRSEKLSVEASLFGTVIYTSSAWLGGHLGDGIQYRMGFGPPLVWLLVNHIRDREGRQQIRAAILLSLCVLAQFWVCMTWGLVCLFIAALRLLLEPGLRSKRILLIASFAVLPTVFSGLIWSIISKPYLIAMGFDPNLTGTYGQIYRRIDVLNLIPFGSLALENYFSPLWPRLDWIRGVSMAPSIITIAACAVAIAEPPRTAPTPEHPIRKSYIWAVLVAGELALLGATYRMGYVAVEYATSAWIAGGLTTAIWALLCHRGAAYLQRSGLFLRHAHPLHVCVVIFVVAVLMGLGPVIFLGGKPVLLGPLAVLNVLVPGLERIRVTAKLLVIGLFPLVLIAAMGAEVLLGRYGEYRKHALKALVGFPIIVMMLGWFNLGGYPFGLFDYPEEACPDCAYGEVGSIPEPYKWLQSNAPGDALLELPAGTSPVPRLGEPQTTGHDQLYLTMQALDGIARVNGNTSHFPPSYLSLLKTLETFPSAESLTAITERNAKWILIHGDRYEADEWDALQQKLAAPIKGLERVRNWGPVWLYRID